MIGERQDSDSDKRLSANRLNTGQTASAQTSLDTYDCLVLSGGGAKGAYGAGVAKGLEKFRTLKDIRSKLCLIGTSAGALNASVLAIEDADSLIKFWRNISDKKVLNVKLPIGMRARAAFNLLRARAAFNLLRGGRGGDKAYAVYSNKALAALIAEKTSLSAIEAGGRSLIVTATNYTTGQLHSFFVSPLVEQFLDDDGKRPVAKQRFLGWRKLDDDKHLRAVLLASASIPFAFQPVKIDGDLFVDGGIGNHTPTRQAAYFLRHVEETGKGRAGEVFCVTQDQPRTLIEGKHSLGPLDILLRTFDVYHYVHTKPIIEAWFRINDEVEGHRTAVERLKTLIATLPLAASDVSALMAEIDSGIGRIGGAARRGAYKMTIIQPSSDLGETLNFDPKAIDRCIQWGYTDMIQTLYNSGRINAPERAGLARERVLT